MEGADVVEPCAGEQGRRMDEELRRGAQWEEQLRGERKKEIHIKWKESPKCKMYFCQMSYRF